MGAQRPTHLRPTPIRASDSASTDLSDAPLALALRENEELRQQIAAQRLLLDLLTALVSEVLAADAEREPASAAARVFAVSQQVRRALPLSGYAARQPGRSE